ncbi:hypothetical protein RIF29_31209 [Crotalaria pallida]|uniref:Uncharacterized protein n=1 Tax=Crotalaria pallida TaxID=3830 RepID=A0AAN9EM79_CROPI
MGNGSSTTSKSKVHHGQQRAKVGSSELSHVSRQGKPSTKVEPNVVVAVPTDEGSLRLKGHYSEQQHGKKSSSSSLDNDDTFNDFIRRAKYKIRSFSNIGREQNNPAPAPAALTPDGANNNINATNYENQKDQFADFIQVAKKKLRTTSRVGKNSSFRD